MFKKYFYGLSLTFSIAFMALFLYNTKINDQLHISSLLFAILIGIIFANFTPISKMEIFQPGVKFTSKKILRFGVILQGFKLSLSELTNLGVEGIIFIGILIPTTILSIKFIGKKFGLDEKLSICLASGTAICGASAIATVGPIIDADEKNTAFGIGAITIFGTFSMFIFPIIYKTFNLDPTFYGAWVGFTLPDVAEVVAASGAIGSTIAETMAIIAKLTRVLFLIPVSIAFSIWKSKQQNDSENKSSIAVPLYVIGFLVAVIINSLNIIPPAIDQFIPKFANMVLTTAMASLGLKIKIKDMLHVGIKPVIVGFMGMIIIQTLGFTGAYILFN